MNVYTKLVKRAENGEMYRLDLLNKTLKIGDEVLVENGIVNGKYSSEKFTKKRLIELFNEYYTSVPSELSGRKHRVCEACKPESLTDFQLFNNPPRLVAQARFEGYLLGMILSGFNFDELDDNKNHWFWQWQGNRHLVIYRSWFKPTKGDTNE